MQQRLRNISNRKQSAKNELWLGILKNEEKSCRYADL